jgi:hypothetical protein
MSSAIGDNASVSTTADNFRNFLIEVQLSWLIQVGFFLMAKLTIISITPSVDFSFVSQKGGVFFSTIEINNFANCMREVNERWLVEFLRVCALNS